MDLALFDFDGTITNKDSFTGFILFSSSKIKVITGLILLFPVIIAYTLGFITAAKTRETLAYFCFKGKKHSDIDRAGREYAGKALPGWVREIARERLEWHRKRGDRIVLVSASLDLYLRHWCAAEKIDLICSTMEVKDGILTGKLVGGDCSSGKKADGVKNKYNLKDFNKIYAYGDTSDDNELLALADVKFYRWKEVNTMSSEDAK